MKVWQELKDKFVPYGFTILLAVARLPSDILFTSLFSPSRYESKLWDLKRQLESPDPNATTLAKEFDDFRPENEKYCLVASRPFIKFVDTITPKHIEGMKEGKYLYYARSAVDWELIRVQPVRYFWNEADHIALYGLGIGAFAGGFVTPKQIFQSIKPSIKPSYPFFVLNCCCFCLRVGDRGSNITRR
jgi:hypothetical protein